MADDATQKMLGDQVRTLSAENQQMRDALEGCKTTIVKQKALISQLSEKPLIFGRLLKVHNVPSSNAFKTGDDVIVVDPTSRYNRHVGTIMGQPGVPPVFPDGHVVVKLVNGIEENFDTGSMGGVAQVRLTDKSDGTFCVVLSDGKPWEVRNVPDLSLKPGDPVKLMPDTREIVAKAEEYDSGPICTVDKVSEAGIEILAKGERHLLFNPQCIDLKEGDRVAVDASLFTVLKKVGEENSEKYRLSDEVNVTWDDVGGLEEEKRELREVLELHFQYPELSAFYGIESCRGVLLYGPPGNGKTMLGRVAAWSLASMHGHKASATSYIYVKAPELFDKWVGNSERSVRELFERGRKHFREHGYKAVLLIDEADALLPQRGTRTSSGITDTIVPMFLAEMDGVDERQTAENPIVFLLTNRSDTLDPAVTRPGRISRHIKINRPDEEAGMAILELHSKKVPFADPSKKDVWLTLTISDLFSKSRVLYRVNNEHDFTMSDCVSGALIKAVVDEAKHFALRRDLASKSNTGVNLDDLRAAVQKVQRQQAGINHTYDLHDFAERKGIQASKMQIERCYASN